MRDRDDVQRETIERLLPAMEDLADAVCRGDATGLDRHQRRLAHLVTTCPDHDVALDVLSLVALLVGEQWDDDRAVGLPAPQPPLLPLSRALTVVQDFLVGLGATRAVAETLLARAGEAGGRQDEDARRHLLALAMDVLSGLDDDDAMRMRAVAEGLLNKSLGRYAAAAAAFEEAARRSEDLDLPVSAASSLAELADTLRAAGGHADAASAYDRAVVLARRADLEDRAGLWGLRAADARVAAGRDAVAMHRFAEASELFATARAGYRAAGPGHARPAASAALHRGIAEFSRARPDSAREWFRTAEAEYEALGDVGGLGDVHFAWGNEALARGDLSAARRMLQAAHTELSSAGRAEAATECLRLLRGRSARPHDGGAHDEVADPPV